MIAPLPLLLPLLLLLGPLATSSMNAPQPVYGGAAGMDSGGGQPQGGPIYGAPGAKGNMPAGEPAIKTAPGDPGGAGLPGGEGQASLRGAMKSATSPSGNDQGDSLVASGEPSDWQGEKEDLSQNILPDNQKNQKKQKVDVSGGAHLPFVQTEEAEQVIEAVRGFASDRTEHAREAAAGVLPQAKGPEDAARERDAARVSGGGGGSGGGGDGNGGGSGNGSSRRRRRRR